MKSTIFLVISLVLIGGLGFVLFEEQKKSNLTFPDFGAALPRHHEVLGIDVSHHQGHINWDLVLKMIIEGDSIQFAFIKLTEGTDFIDKDAKRNSEALLKAKIPFGYYHFYNPKESAIAQANYLIENAAKTTLKPVLDIEVKGELTKSQLIDSVLLFMTIVKRQLGINPIIYTYESFYSDLFASSPLQNEWFWIANYTGKSTAFDKQHVIAWQFTDKGTVDGISEKVDLNTAKPNFWKVAVWE
jgi:lysozyme